MRFWLGDDLLLLDPFGHLNDLCIMFSIHFDTIQYVYGISAQCETKKKQLEEEWEWGGGSIQLYAITMKHENGKNKCITSQNIEICVAICIRVEMWWRSQYV